MTVEDALFDRLDEIESRLMSRLDEILAAIETKPGNAAGARTPLESQVLDVLRKNPTRWFQPKDFISEGIHATAQPIGAACTRLVSRRVIQMKRKSEVTGFEPGQYEYDPKMYQYGDTR